jgi:hypothetical protein
LTRVGVAIHLGMHESTVRRATAATTVMLPSGEIMPLSEFFAANPRVSVKEVLKSLLEHETALLSDQQLADALAELGIPVARRTVARHREQLGILPASRRRAVAQARARALLDDLLDEGERAQLARRGYLQIASPTCRHRFYRIPRRGGRVRLYEHGKVTSELCVGPVEPLPGPDVILLHKLLIQADEEAYLARANRFPAVLR